MKIKLLLVLLLSTLISTAQFTESFESAIPATWTVINNGGANAWIQESGPNGGAQEGTAVASIEYNSSSHDDYLITPSINVVSNVNDRISFYVKSRSSTFLESYEVLLSTTGVTDTDFTVVLQSSQIASNSWTQLEFNLSPYIGQTVYVALRATGTDEFQLFADNFVNDGNPTCVEPSILNAASITAISANLGWTSGGSGETLWDVEYGADGFTQGTGTIVAANSNPYTLNTLTESTDYDYYVRANCGGDVSAWAGPFSFSTPASCLVPTALDAANITSSSADLSWTSGGSGESSWEVEYGGDGFTQGTGTTITPATNPVSTTGLMSNTDYDYYVRANCGAGDYSEWAGPFSFTTLCAAEIPDYLEDFSSYIPSCWLEAVDGDPVNGPSSLGSSLWAEEEFAHLSSSGNGGVNINIYQTDDIEWLLSPQFDLSAGGYEINLDIAFTNYNATTQGVFDADDDVRLLYTLDGVTWTTIVQWNAANGNTPAAAGETFNADLSAITGSNVQFAIYSNEGATASGDKDFHIDNFQIRTIPSCQEPTNLAVTNITATSADLGWTVSGSSETMWDVEYGVTGFTQGGVASTIVDNTSNNPYNASGLTESTDYDFYVRAHCGVGNESEWAGPFSFSTPASCLVPTALSAANITATSADLSWTSGGSGEASWEVEYGVDGFTQGAGTIVTPATNPYNLTGLTANTAYDYYVRANCGGGDFSEWVGPYSFTTPCDAFNIPFTENFDSSTTGSSLNTNAPNCWSFIDSGSGYVYVYDNSATNVQSGAKSYRLYNGFISSGDYMLISPEIAELTTDGIQVQFSAKGANGQELELGTITDPNDASTFTVLTTTTLTSSSFEDIEINIPTSTDSYFAVRHGQTGSYDSYYLDDFSFSELPACVSPTGLTASNITATSAILSWTSGGSGETSWEIEYGVDGFTQGAGTIVTPATNPYNLTGLTANTAYDYYVRANCGGGDYSEWGGPFSFFTGHCIPTASNTIASTYIDNFITSGAVIDIDNSGTGRSGEYSNYYNTNTVTTYVGQSFDITVNEVSGTVGTAVWVDWNKNFQFEISEILVNTTTYGSDFSQTVTIPSGISNGDYRLRVMIDYSDSNPDDNACELIRGEVEDYKITIVDPPACLTPTALSASNITATSVDLSWTSGGSGETAWEVEYGTDGFIQGSGTIMAASSNLFTLNSLTESTDYDYYVRANCGAGDYSEWVGPYSSTTLVGPHNYPLIEDFENGFSLFDNGDNNDVDFSISTIYYHTGSQSAHNDYDGSDDNYLNETGILDLSTSTNPELKFWQIAKTEGTYDKCHVQISIDGGSTYLDLPSSAYSGTSTDYPSVGYFHEDSYAIWGTGTETPDNSTWWQEEVFSLAAYKVANVRIRFFLESDFSGNREGWFIDDISISEKLSDYIWNGTAWNNTPEGNITSNDNMIIQSGTMPSLTGAISVNDLTIETGASLEVDNGNITVSGDLVNNGTISGSNEVVFIGDAEFITGTGTMNNLTVGSTGAIVVAGQQSILQQLDVISGGSLSIDASGDLTLVSNAMGTARVDAVDAGSITGNVNVERYIPAGNRAFRFLGSTVSGASVFDSWQEAGNNSAGFGVQVTGTAGTVGTVNINGHDETATGNQSLFKWDNSAQSWSGVTNTKSEILNAGDFYRVFIRGDRMNDLSASNPSSTATTLRTTGTLMTGPMTVTPGTSVGEFFALANPYQSKLSMAAATTAGVAADMYYWDPNVGPRGTYSTISISSGIGTIGNATNVLEPGQAVFFADSGASSSITIEESNKVGGNNNVNLFRATPLQQVLRLKIYQTSRFNNSQTASDGIYIDFDSAHNLNLDSNDAVKLNGLNVNMAIAKSTGELLSVERRTLPDVNEVVGLNMSNYLTTAYTFNATLDILPGVTVYLKDTFTGTITEIAQGGSTAIDFTVDLNDAQSINAARFEIVFQRSTLGNDDHLFTNSINVYPNPVNGDVIYISLGSLTEEKVQVTLFNTLGQQVISKDFNSNSNDTIRLDRLSSLESGLYILNISNGMETVTRKIILN